MVERDNLTATVAEYAAATSIHAIPADVRECAKHVILDEMGSAYFGSRRPAGVLAARYAASVGGPADATVLGTDLRTSAPYAALANGTAGHADEIDGAHVVGGHPAATLVHAAMATAERRHASGAELLNAVVLGYDVGIRLSAACGGFHGFKERHGMHSDFLFAVGAAVACGRILGLDADRLRHAMALVTFQANGLCALFQERRHISKAFCNGQYAFAGVSAAHMAAVGLEGSDDILGDTHGVLDAWAIDGAEESVARGLGTDYAVLGANFKFVRAGYPIHAVVEAAMTLVERHDIKVDAISAVEVGMPTHALRVVDNRRMHNICVQDMLAVALVRDGLRLRESYFPEILDDPAFQRVRAAISVRPDALLDEEQPEGRGAVVTITTENGDAVTHKVDHPRGHSLRGGVTWPELADKWRDATPDGDVDTWLTLTRGLEDLADVTELSTAFARGR